MVVGHPILMGMRMMVSRAPYSLTVLVTTCLSSAKADQTLTWVSRLRRRDLPGGLPGSRAHR
jgi:hypothetical protein